MLQVHRERFRVLFAINEIEIDVEYVYGLEEIDSDVLEVLFVDISLLIQLDALVFMQEILKRCRRRPPVRVERSP